MSLSDKGDRATFRDATPTGPKGETVTVVDARRYIGLAQAGNAAAVTTAISQDPQWAASLSATGGLSHSEAAATGKVVNTLKIQMHPIELGLVTATLRLHGDDLVVSLQVETGEAYRQLTDDQDAIVRALRGQGFAVDQVNVQLAPADRSSNAQQGDSQSQQQQQFSNQPQAREGGNGRQGGNGEGAGNFSHEGASHEGTTSDNAPGLAGGQPQRSGGVYL
jgi:chemotaxis protein MotD